MKKTIKSLEQSIYNGKVSYKVSFEDGVNGLLTNSTLVKEMGGNLPGNWKDGAEVDVEIDEVQKKDGSGSWTSVKPASQGSSPSSGGKYSFKGEDVYSKMVNTAMLATSNIIGEKPDVNFKVVTDLFEGLLESMINNYKKYKQ